MNQAVSERSENQLNESGLLQPLILLYNVCIETPRMPATFVLDICSDNKYFTSLRQISFRGLPRSLYGEELLLQPVASA